MSAFVSGPGPLHGKSELYQSRSILLSPGHSRQLCSFDSRHSAEPMPCGFLGCQRWNSATVFRYTAVGGYPACGGRILGRLHWVHVYCWGMAPAEVGYVGRLYPWENRSIEVWCPGHICRAPSIVCRQFIFKCGSVSRPRGASSTGSSLMLLTVTCLDNCQAS